MAGGQRREGGTDSILLAYIPFIELKITTFIFEFKDCYNDTYWHGVIDR